MGKIYFVRHGESEWNVTDQICGQTDVPLTEKDISRRRKPEKYCGEWDFCGSYPVFASFARKQTVQHIAEMTGIPFRLNRG